MEVATTENVFREWDDSGKLLREISTLTQTRTPVAPVKPRFGFELPWWADVRALLATLFVLATGKLRLPVVSCRPSAFAARANSR